MQQSLHKQVRDDSQACMYCWYCALCAVCVMLMQPPRTSPGPCAAHRCLWCPLLAERLPTPTVHGCVWLFKDWRCRFDLLHLCTFTQVHSVSWGFRYLPSSKLVGVYLTMHNSTTSRTLKHRHSTDSQTNMHIRRIPMCNCAQHRHFQSYM